MDGPSSTGGWTVVDRFSKRDGTARFYAALTAQNTLKSATGLDLAPVIRVSCDVRGFVVLLDWPQTLPAREGANEERYVDIIYSLDGGSQRTEGFVLIDPTLGLSGAEGFAFLKSLAHGSRLTLWIAPRQTPYPAVFELNGIDAVIAAVTARPCLADGPS